MSVSPLSLSLHVPLDARLLHLIIADLQLFNNIVLYLPDTSSMSYSIKLKKQMTRNQLVAILAKRGYDAVIPVSGCPPALLFSNELARGLRGIFPRGRTSW